MCSGTRQTGWPAPSAAPGARRLRDNARGPAAGRGSGGRRSAGSRMQLRYATELTAAEYVERAGWDDIEPPECPFHPRGGCQLVGHGTYERKSPPGMRVKRFRCRRSGATVSLLPDFLPARTPGTMAGVERVVRAVEDGVPGTADNARAVALAQRVRAVLVTLRTLYPDRFASVEPTLAAFGVALGSATVLGRLRAVAAGHLPWLATPVGFRHPRPPNVTSPARSPRQQSTGRDPPRGAA